MNRARSPWTWASTKPGQTTLPLASRVTRAVARPDQLRELLVEAGLADERIDDANVVLDLPGLLPQSLDAEADDPGARQEAAVGQTRVEIRLLEGCVPEAGAVAADSDWIRL